MSRLIDADAIISFIDAGHLQNPLELAWSDNDVVDMIESRPTIDAVPVVRCNDCKHHEVFKDGANGWCNGHGCQTDVTYFCADGERKDGE